MKAQNIAYQTEGLNGRPSIGMELSRSYVEGLKDAHREVIKR